MAKTNEVTQAKTLDDLLAQAKGRTASRIAAMSEAIQACKVDGRLDRTKFESALPPIRGATVKVVAPELGRDGLILPSTSSTSEIAKGLGKVGPTIEKAHRSFGERATAEVSQAETRDVVASIISRVVATHGESAGQIFADAHNESLIETLKNRTDMLPDAILAIAERRLVQ